MFSSLYSLGLLQHTSGLIIATLYLNFPTDIIESWSISTGNFEVLKPQFGHWTINGDCLGHNWIARRKLVNCQMFVMWFLILLGSALVSCSWMFCHVSFESIGPATWVTALWGFSPVWTRRWVFRCSVRLNDFPHSSQWCGFSPLWMSTCWVRFDFVIVEKSQYLHWCGFSKECVLMCIWRVPACGDA